GWKLDGGLTVGVWSDNVSRSIKELSVALGEKPSGHAVTGAGDLPPLSILDFIVVDALVDNPKIPFKELVEVTGLSPKTVRKHLGDVNSKNRALSRLQGIESAAVTLNRELVFANDFIHLLVRERIQEMGKTRTSQVVFA